MNILAIPIALIAVLFILNRVGNIGSGIVPPQSTDDIKILIAKKAREWDIDPPLLKAVVRVESNFNPRAKNPADPSYGLMQITPMLAQDYGKVKDYTNPTKAEIDMLYEPSWNLDIGCEYLSMLLRSYGFDQAIQSYNVGETGYFWGRRNPDYLSKVRQYYESYS